MPDPNNNVDPWLDLLSQDSEEIDETYLFDSLNLEDPIYGPHGLRESPGVDIDPSRKKEKAQKTVSTGSYYSPSTGVVGGGTQTIVESDDMYSTSNIPVEYDDGTEGYISFGELNEDWNPNLKRKYKDIEQEIANYSFEPVTKTRNIPTGDSMDTKLGISPTEEYTHVPYEKELSEIRDYLVELKENSEMNEAQKIMKIESINNDPKRYEATGYAPIIKELPTLNSHLPKEFHFDDSQPSDELVQEYFKHQQLRTKRAEARRYEIDRGLREMTDIQRKATLKASKKIKSEAGKNLEQDQEDFKLNLAEFENNPSNKKIKEFELNVLNPEYKFDTSSSEETIELKNGKVLPLSTWEKYKRDLTDYNTNKDELVTTLNSLIDRQEKVSDSNEELDLLGRNYSLADKFLFNVSTTTGDLTYGLLDLATGGTSRLAQNRRYRVQEERKTYRPDIKFDNAFDSWGNFGSFIVEETGKQAPIFAAIALSGGTASYFGAGMYASAAISGTTLGLMTGGQQMGDMTFEEYNTMLDGLTSNDVEYSSLQKIGTGIGFGAAEGIFGTAPTFLLGRRWAKSAYSAFARNNMDDLLKVSGKDYFKKKFLKEAGLGLVSEAPSEGLTQITQNAITDKPILEGVDHATFSGGFFGVVLGGGSVAIGAAGRSMMNTDEKLELENMFADIKDANVTLEGLDGRTTEGRLAKKRRDELVKEAEAKIEEFEGRWSSKMTKSAYETYKQMIIEQTKLRNQAFEINNDKDISNESKQKELEKLAFDYGVYQQQIDKFKNPNFYANKFEGIKVTEPERYKTIIEKAKQNLKGTELTDSKLNKEAYDIYLQQEIDNRSKAADKLLKSIGRDWTKHRFKNENEAKSYAATVLESSENLTKEQRDFWKSIVDAEPNSLNGTAASVNGSYTYVTIDDTAKQNEREATESHEISHLVFWDLLNIKGEQFKPLADAITEHLKKHEPAVYDQMFGEDGSQRVERDEKGNYIPMEVVMGLVERADKIDMSKFQNKHLMGYIGRFISGKINSDAVDLSTNDNVVSFLVQLGKKIKDGTLTKQDIDKANKNKVFQETIKTDKSVKNASDLENKIEENAKSESTLFETTEMMGDGWSKLSENDKIQRAQSLGLYWENFLEKKIKQQITADETEILSLLNKFTGLSHNTSSSPINQSYAAKRGFIDIVKRWDPAKNNSLAAWIQSANNLPMRILELSQTSKKFGRFESSIDEQREGSRQIEIVETSKNADVVLDENELKSNEFRSLLKIEDNSETYNKVVYNVSNTLSNQSIKPLIKTNPKKLRQVLKKEFEKNTAKDISNIIGTQKSDKFKKFITNKENLQKIIDLLGVKYRNRFPMFTTSGGRANVQQSKIIQQSDQGSFIADAKAGNQIWIPKNVDEMSDQEIQDISNEFTQGRETKYKSLKNALANDLSLDAVFTAMKSNPDVEVQYEGVIGELSEAIKRDPQKAFSQSEIQSFEQLAREVIKKGYEAVYDSPGKLSTKYINKYSDKIASTIQEVYDNGLFQEEKVYQFLRAVQRNPLISDKLKNEVKKALTKKSDIKIRTEFGKDMQILSFELGSDIVNVMSRGSEFSLVGLINRVLDPAKKKKSTGLPGDFNSLLNKIRKLSPKQNDLPIELDVSKVRLMNTKISGGLFDRINKVLNDPNIKTKEQRIALLNDFKQEIIDANNHNKILLKHIIKKIVKSKISDASLIRMLQLQTNAAEGLRALTALKYITVTDGPIGKLKGEHLADNAGTMLEIVDLRFKKLSDSELDTEIDQIIEFHDQWLENRDKLDVVDVFGKNNPNKDLRIRLLPKSDQANVMTFDMQPAETLIKKRENKIKLIKDNKRTKNSRNALEIANSLSSANKKGISVFDFDDTLARTKSKILVTLNGNKFKIDATEFALQSADLEAAGAAFDFSDFNKVVEGKKGPLADLALKRQGKFGSGDIYVLTARPKEAAYAIHTFLKGIGLNVPIDNITGLADGRPEAKADWIINKVSEGYNDFYFADDAIKNIKAVADILKDVDVKSRVELAFSKVDINTFEDKINEIIERQSGILKDAKFSKLVAKRRGSQKGKYNLLPASMDDFKGMLYYFTGKGDQGSKDLDFLMKEINDVYHRAIDAINIAKTSLVTDYKKLRKQYPEITKKLNKIIPSTDFTYDQAIRVYIWNKQGMEIPDISKRDLNKLLKAVKSDIDFKEFADQVQIIGTGLDGVYNQPETGWDVGTILGDLDNLSNKVGRKRFLKDWIERMDAMFTPDVMNKIEAIYGTRFREAFDDIVFRMKNGTNRATGQNRQTNAWLNWINNSVGTIMFFNRRSALLQSISTINFLNWSDNSILKAGLAFANQPQYWKDFSFIWNSPKLKQRRRGLQTDLQWQEIANQAKRGKNKVNAVISYLLQIGFTPTQLVDNFAIASGGATFYRNRVNTYLKEGMSKKDAETKAWEDFSKVAEETQQSGDPALISQEQASVLGRLVLSFQNTPMQMVRLQKKSGMMIYKRQKYPGMSQKQSDLTNIGKIIYYGAIQNFIFTTLQSALFTVLPGFDEDDDPDILKNLEKEEAKKVKVINNMIDTVLRGSGIKGAVISSIKNVILRYNKEEKKGFMADHTYTLLEAFNISPPIGSKARKLYGAQQTKKFNKEVIEARGFSVTADGKLNLSPAYDIVGNLSSALLNIPLDRVINELESVIEMTDQRNAKWQRIALGLGWRTWDVGVRNEEEDLIKILQKIKNKNEKKKNKQKDLDLFD